MYDALLAYFPKLFLATEMLAALFGAVVGAVVGGVISYWIKLKELREVQKIRDSDQRTMKQSLAYSLLFKIIEMDSNANAIMRVVEESIAEGRKAGLPEDTLWNIVKPIPNLPEKVTFSSEEMSMLLSLKEDKVFNGILLMDTRYNSTVEAFRFYGKLKQSLKELVPPQQFEGGVGKFVADEDQSKLAVPLIYETEQLIREAVENLVKDIKALDLATNDASRLFGEKLGLNIGLKRK